MGFFNGIKRALGFSENGDEHDDELDGIDGRAARSPYVNPFKNDKPAADEPNKTPSQPYTAPTTSLGDAEEGIVPMSKHMAAKQAAATHSTPDSTPSHTPAHTPAQVHQAVPAGLEKDINAVLQSYFASHGSQQTDDDSLRSRLKQSEDQRRALQARYNTLSQRVSDMESEAEKAEVEKKALLNKLKVAQMQANKSDNDALNQQIDSIAAEYKEKMELTNALLNEIRSEAVRKSKEAEQLREQLLELQKSDKQSQENSTILQQKIKDAQASISK